MTPHAFILIPFGVALFLFSPKWLYRFLIVSVAFSGTAVLNIGSGENASGVQVWMFFGFLWLLRDCGSRLAKGNLALRGALVAPVLRLALFVLVVSLSLIMPLYIDGRLAIESPVLPDTSTTPLFFGLRQVTSWLYIVFGSLLAISIAQRNRTVSEIAETGKLYLGSGVFVSLWGLFQLLCALVHLPYPQSIFNNSASPGASGYITVLPDIAFKRMSSVALEPSILSQVLLTILPLTLPAILGCGYLISRRVDRACFLLISLALVLTTSSSAYVGLLVFGLMSAVAAVRMKITERKAMLKAGAWTALAALVVLPLLYTQVLVFRTIVIDSVFSKSSSYSALERLKTIQNGWSYFLQYPLLGVGWGSVTSHDLVVKLLANIGVLGLLTFAVVITWLASRLYRGIRQRRDDVALTQMVWLLSLIMLIFMNAISEFAYVLGHFWLILGVAMSCTTISGYSTEPGAIRIPAREGPGFMPGSETPKSN